MTIYSSKWKSSKVIQCAFSLKPSCLYVIIVGNKGSGSNDVDPVLMARKRLL